MSYCEPDCPSFILSPRRKPRRVIRVLAASSTEGGGPSSWLSSPGGMEGEMEMEGERERIQINTTVQRYRYQEKYVWICSRLSLRGSILNPEP
jgi:hypothetical protein